jgi:hypothetical protein
VVQSGADIHFDGGAVTNAAGAVYDFQAGSLLDHSGALFTNAGTLEKSTGAGTTATVGVAFTSAGGTVEVDAGTLTISSSIAQVSGSTLTGGVWEVLAGSTLNFGSGGPITTNEATVILSGVGSKFTPLDTLAKNAGRFSILRGRNLNAGDFTNTGSVTVGADCRLAVSGNYTQAHSGSLDIELGGFLPNGPFGQLNVTRKAALDGALGISLVNGYVPRAGDSFLVMSYSQESGSFPALQGLLGTRSMPLEAAVGAMGIRINSRIDAADLAVSSVTILASGVPGQDTTITFSVQNTRSFATSVSHWVDSVYLSPSDTLTGSAKLIGRVSHIRVVAGNSVVSRQCCTAARTPSCSGTCSAGIDFAVTPCPARPGEPRATIAGNHRKTN